MSDDWNWDDGHSDHSGYDGSDDHSGYDGSGDHHDAGFHHDDADPFGSDVPDGLGGDLAGHHDLTGHDDLPGHDDQVDYGDDGGFDAGDPFAPHALVSEHHDWSDGLDDGTGIGDDGLAGVHDAGLFTVDPDVAAYTDGVWPSPEFPAALDLHDISPIDGPPWTDASALGIGLPDADPLPTDVPDVSELAAYAGLDPTSASAGWDALLGSDDPATSALARFWGPPTS
ncbi:hypothetical protein DFJ67_6678 [Asanoa ferruginea]|uniref:Uncharacterized protein n=1 Tax=Asanoa ferruginea TaxID=53367 RepID=A0A3D9ZVT7_9ACTN|nr:hypothetical protein [Asanoa ferruginea]REG00623.1 hypothetical protein DFJ67_6678 [Asanoa ferruginea]GIF47786.1 hypothetical protein Afe04nite_23250 [Asanoa ferruginea]